MLLFLLRRAVQAIAVLFAISVIFFTMLHATGDPIELLMPPSATPEQVDQMRHHLGLDRSILTQYATFLKNALHGELGVSFYHGEPALNLVLAHLPATMELVAAAMIISLILSLPLGVLSGSHKNSLTDRMCLLGSLFGISAPPFLIGIVCILVFSVELNWLPSCGRGGLDNLILPASSMALYRLALFVRLLRAGMLDVLSQDYIRTARSKGLSEKTVVYKHAFRNTLIPFVTISGLQTGSILAGAIVTEKVFAWPGMGRLFLDAITKMDYPVVIAWALVTASMFVIINTIVDIVYVWIDPRIRLER